MSRKRLWLVGIVAVVLAVFAFYAWDSWPEWDPSAESSLISFEPGSSEVDYSYIPDFQVWGDGRIIWVEYAPGRSRRVFEGRLSKAQLDDIMGKFFFAGFFNPLNKSQGFSTGDSLRITLRNDQIRRNIGAEQTPVFGLANYLRKGAGAARKDYVPVRGDLYVFLATDLGKLSETVKPEYQWPDQKFGYTLESVYKDGRPLEITGDELEFVWTAVNSGVPLVASEGVIYWIAMIVPGISE